ncbi:MAG TPA: ribosome assembly RNA-binding protein YhbY [Fusobacteriaceae bacterium]|jgi:RNA-binding protein|nr:ribosome assembly RNA-binding protein YhbY [Fusobacteriaceae bacterium]
MKLTSKKRAYLRKLSHDISPLVRVGKDGFNENIVKSILDAIDKRELIKVKILQNAEVDKKELAAQLAEKSSCEVVGITGRIITLYKENKEYPVISEDLRRI